MAANDYQERLGERLRAIRQQQDLTLQEVEEKSSGEWKAVVVGSYERGDRAVSVAKLSRLADFYGVPLAELLPTEPSRGAAAGADTPPQVTIDLVRLETAADPDVLPLRRFVQTIQARRGDYNGRVLSLRRDDLLLLAVTVGTGPDELAERLQREGLAHAR